MGLQEQIREHLDKGQNTFFFADHNHSSQQVQSNFRQALREVSAAIGDTPKILFIEENHMRRSKLYPDPTDLLARFKAKEDITNDRLEVIAMLEEAHKMGFSIIPVDWDKSELKKLWDDAHSGKYSHLSAGEQSDLFAHLREQRMTGSNEFMANKIEEELQILPPNAVSIVRIGNGHLGRSRFRSADGRNEIGVDQRLGGAVFDVTNDGVNYRGYTPKAPLPPSGQRQP